MPQQFQKELVACVCTLLILVFGGVAAGACKATIKDIDGDGSKDMSAKFR